MCSKGAARLAEAVPDRYGKQLGAHAGTLSWVPAAVGWRSCVMGRAGLWIPPCSGSLYPASGRRSPRGERTWKRSLLRPDNNFRKQRPSHGEQAVGGGGGKGRWKGLWAGAAGSAPRPLSALGPCRGTAAVTPLSGTQSPEFTAPSPESEKMNLTLAPPWLHFGESSSSC